jgi:hypothetical protein
MRLSTTVWLMVLGIATLSHGAALQKRDADFLSVRTKLHKDMSGKRGDPKEKYFRELLLIPKSSAAKIADEVHSGE